MWKITTRGLTLEEVLIMAAMNLLTSADTSAKRENWVCRNLKESKHATEVLSKTSSTARLKTWYGRSTQNTRATKFILMMRCWTRAAYPR